MNDPKTRKKLLWAVAIGGALLLSLLFVSLLAPSQPGISETPTIRTSANGEILLDAQQQSAAVPANSGGGFSLGGGELISLAWRLLLVVIIIAVSIAGLRWWGRKASGPKSSTGFLRVVDTLAISNGRTIHLVALGDRVIAIGATAQQLTLLNELTGPEATTVLDAAARPDEQPISQFATQLFEQMKRTAGRNSTPSRNESVIGG